MHRFDIIQSDMENIYERNLSWELLRNKTILISGAYGMLASYFVFFLIYLNERDNMNIHIISLGRSREKYLARFGEYCEREYMTFICDSLYEPIQIQDRIDYIVHAASLASPQYYRVSPVDVLMPNTIGTYYLLELAIQKKVNCFLLFSSGDIYGVVKNADSIDESIQGTLDPLDIHNCYSESKRMAETICNAFYTQYNVPIKILRIWHTYSPTMDIEQDPRVFASFAGNIIRNENIVMKSNGLQKRSFCYIADAIAGYFYVLLNGRTGEAYNVCNSEQFISIRELAEKLTSIFPEKKLIVIEKERDTNDSYVESTVSSNIMPSDKKLRSLGWSPQFSVEDGFKKVIDFYTDNKL